MINKEIIDTLNKGEDPRDPDLFKEILLEDECDEYLEDERTRKPKGKKLLKFKIRI